MKTLLALACALALSVLAAPARSFELSHEPQAYLGARSSVGFMLGSKFPSLLVGLDTGVAGESGLGGGVRLLGLANSPKIYGEATSPYAFGAMVDLKYFFSALSYLDFYPSLSAGFLAGVGKNGSGVQLFPMLEGSVGTRLKLAPLTKDKLPLYLSMDVGLDDFVIPFVTFGVGMTFGEIDLEEPAQHAEAPSSASQPYRPSSELEQDTSY